MPTIQEALMQGWQFQRSGQLAAAEQVYRSILSADPDNAEIHYLLGTVCHFQGKLDEAARNLLSSVGLKPDYAEAHNNLGVVMAIMGRRPEAIHHFSQYVRLRPGDPDAVNNLGNALREHGSLNEAIQMLSHALQLRPDFPNALHNLGLALHDLGNLPEAAARLREAVRLRPDFADAHNDLGLVLAKLKNWNEAIAEFQQLIRLRPDRADGYAHLGAALREIGRLEESAERLRHAVRLKPNDVNVRSSLGLTLQQLGHSSESEENLRIALALDPNHADSHNNLGITLSQMGRFPEAIEQYDMAIALKPDQAIYRRNRGLAWLTIGEFARGWDDYEYRWKCPGFNEREFPAPAWNGESLKGKTILIYWEQGLGDTIQLVRYATLVKRLGANVLVQVQAPLVRLLSQVEGIDKIVSAGETVPKFDYHAALGSLPRIFRTTTETIPAEIPYLRAEQERVGYWGPQLSATPGFKIGIAWRGNPKQLGDRFRSIPLVHFASLSRVEGVQLFSLQKDAGTEELRDLAENVPIIDLARRLDLSGGAFLDTAAVMMNLDLVVTCDTSIGHLAGALGVPVWVALSASADWRWMESRENTPWYPTMRLFRQTTFGRWDDVFERIAAEVRRAMVGTGTHQAIPIEVSPGELIDKITILQIKNERVQNPAKLQNIRTELAALTAVCDDALPPYDEVSALALELKQVNEAIWEVEDALRRCEKEQRFDGEFIELARRVYRNNDHRAAIKRRINDFYSAHFIEEKEHPEY
jgi:tetratricopeptide (TPR) repeat protein